MAKEVAKSHVQRKTIIRNVHVFDGNGFTPPKNVFIEGGFISGSHDIPDETVDGKNGFLLPGFIDAHVHLEHEGHLQQLAKYGVTTALDMAAWPAEKINALRSRPGLTDIRSAGLPATAPGSIHSHVLPLPKEALQTDPGNAEKFVQRRIAEGSDYIKIIADVPGPSQEMANALADKAHANGKSVVVHAAAYVPFQMALEAKGDVITHAPLDKPVDSEMVQKMTAGNMCSVPTLIMMQENTKGPPISAILSLLFQPSLFLAILRSQRSGVGTRKYQNAKDSVAAMYKGGVPILAGSDCHDHVGKNSLFDVKHGNSFHDELKLLVEAGLTTIDALRAATILPAERFNLSDRGIIEEGKRADLVLLSEDPIQNIQATRSIERVWCGGTEVKNTV